MTDGYLAKLQADVDSNLDNAVENGQLVKRPDGLFTSDGNQLWSPITAQEVAEDLTTYCSDFDGSTGPDRLFDEVDDPIRWAQLISCITTWAGK